MKTIDEIVSYIVERGLTINNPDSISQVYTAKLQVDLKVGEVLKRMRDDEPKQMKTTLNTMLNTCRRTSLSITRFRVTVPDWEIENFLQQIQTTLSGLQHQIKSLQEEVEK